MQHQLCWRLFSIRKQAVLHVTLGKVIDGFFSIRKPGRSERHPGGAIDGFVPAVLVTLILVGAILQFAARLTDRAEH
jgi:hypothetical protein